MMYYTCKSSKFSQRIMHENESFELIDALAFGHGIQLVDSVTADATELMPRLDSSEWDPQLILEALEEYNDPEHSTTDQAEQLPTPASELILDQEDRASGTPKRKKKQFNPNKARDERRYQVNQLRKEVEDLELTLKQWQDIRRKQSISTNLDKEDRPPLDDNDKDVPAVWEEICGNQLRQRLEAERENIRLKQKCNEELQLVRRIEKLLFKRLKQRVAPQSEANKYIRRTNLPPGYIKHIAAVLFEELSAGIDICYLLGKEVLGAKTSIPGDMASRMLLLRGGLKGTERKLFDRRFLLFSRHATSDAWWSTTEATRGRSQTMWLWRVLG